MEGKGFLCEDQVAEVTSRLNMIWSIANVRLRLEDLDMTQEVSHVREYGNT